MVNALSRSLVLALVASALGAAPARATDEVTALRESIQQQQEAIADAVSGSSYDPTWAQFVMGGG